MVAHVCLGLSFRRQCDVTMLRVIFLLVSRGIFKKMEQPQHSSSSASSGARRGSVTGPRRGSVTAKEATDKVNKFLGGIFNTGKRRDSAPPLPTEDANAKVAVLEGQLEATKLAMADVEKQLSLERKRHSQTVQQLVALRQKNAASKVNAILLRVMFFV